MDFDWNSLVNYGALGICLAYFIYKDNKTSKELQTAVNRLCDIMNIVQAFITKGANDQ